MKMILLVLATLVSAPALAQAELSGVVSAITLDLNGDGGFDRAVLNSPNGGDADLYVYLSEGEGMVLNTYLPEAVWSGMMWGTLPSLAQNEAGSLLINSANDAIGRSRWSQTLTVAYRGGQLVVGGITYNWNDTLDGTNGSCDLNLFTGKGKINGKAVKAEIGPVVLSNWNSEIVGDVCGIN